MMDERERRLEEMLRKGPRPSPPEGLNRAIKAEIPEVITTAGTTRSSSRTQLWLLAAALVLMVGAGWVGYHLIVSQAPQPSGRVAESPSMNEADDGAVMTAEKRERPEELAEAQAELAPQEESVPPQPVDDADPEMDPQQTGKAFSDRFAPAPAVATRPRTDAGSGNELAGTVPARSRRERVPATLDAEMEAGSPPRSLPPPPPAAASAMAPAEAATSVSESATIVSKAPPIAEQKQRTAAVSDRTSPPLSYEQVHDLLLGGEMPNRGSVDIETLVNHFDYGDRPPWRRGKVSVSLEGGAAPFRPGRWRTIRVGVTAGTAKEAIGADARLLITFDTAAVGLYRRVGSTQTVDPARTPSLTIELGEIGPEMRRSFLYEIKLLPEVDLDQTVATVSLSYVAPDDEEVAVSRGLKSGHIAPTWTSSSTSLRLATLVGAWGETLKGEARGISPIELLVYARELEEAPDADVRVRELRQLIEQSAKLTPRRRR